MKIIINVGHGGKDPGAVNASLKVTEHDYNKKLGNAVLSELTKMGHHAIIVIQDNRGVGAVAGMCNKHNPDVVVSLHSNASSNLSATGTETLYWHTSKNGKRLAECIQYNMVKALGLPDRGCKPRDNLAVLRDTKCPAVIVEPFFISNNADYQLAVAEMNALSTAIADGVDNYFLKSTTVL